MKYLDIADVQKIIPTLLDDIADSPEEVMITRNGIAVAVMDAFSRS